MAKAGDKAILYDSTLCTACRGCQAACKEWNEDDEGAGEKTVNTGSYTNPPDLSPKTWLTMLFQEVEKDGQLRWLFGRRSCMHCTDAGCVRACPDHALYYHEAGFVAYNKSICTGCGYCVDACPFKVPRLTRNALTGIALMDKCTFCTTLGLNRVDEGWEPACVKSCPPRALRYGNWSDMVAEGKKHVETLKAKGHSNAYLYGENEVGGTHVLYVLDDAPERYGLPANPRVSAATVVWKGILQPVGWALGGLTILGLGLNYIVARESKLARERLAGKKE